MSWKPRKVFVAPPKGMTKKQQLEYAVTSELQRYVKKADEEQVAYEPADPYRFFFLRPSSFPFCGLKKFLESQTGVPQERATGFGMGFFTGVGTTVHSVYQLYLGRAGSIYGDWKCKCKTKSGAPRIRRFQTYEWCADCQSAPLYEELEIDYKDTLLGHADTVWKDRHGRYWVVDYKTTSSKKVDKHNAAIKAGKPGLFPYKGNTFQITAYVPALELQHNIKISGTILFYVSRDNPFHSHAMVANFMDDATKAERLADLDRDIKIHRKMLKVRTAEQAEVLLKYRLCEDRADYDANYRDEYNECPYLDQCLGPQPSMDKVVEKALRIAAKSKVYPLIRHASPAIKEKLGITYTPVIKKK